MEGQYEGSNQHTSERNGHMINSINQQDTYGSDNILVPKSKALSNLKHFIKDSLPYGENSLNDSSTRSSDLFNDTGNYHNFMNGSVEHFDETDGHSPNTKQISTPEPKPLISTNVTMNDNIWMDNFTSPKASGGKNGKNELSPPLKSFNVTENDQLWDPNLNLLDVQTDSEDGGSISSSDTMIMMTTEECRKNEESIAKSIKQYNIIKKSATSDSDSSLPNKLKNKKVTFADDISNRTVTAHDENKTLKVKKVTFADQKDQNDVAVKKKVTFANSSNDTQNTDSVELRNASVNNQTDSNLENQSNEDTKSSDNKKSIAQKSKDNTSAVSRLRKNPGANIPNVNKKQVPSVRKMNDRLRKQMQKEDEKTSFSISDRLKLLTMSRRSRLPSDKSEDGSNIDSKNGNNVQNVASNIDKENVAPTSDDEDDDDNNDLVTSTYEMDDILDVLDDESNVKTESSQELEKSQNAAGVSPSVQNVRNDPNTDNQRAPNVLSASKDNQRFEINTKISETPLYSYSEKLANTKPDFSRYEDPARMQQQGMYKSVSAYGINNIKLPERDDSEYRDHKPQSEYATYAEILAMLKGKSRPKGMSSSSLLHSASTGSIPSEKDIYDKVDANYPLSTNNFHDRVATEPRVYRNERNNAAPRSMQNQGVAEQFQPHKNSNNATMSNTKYANTEKQQMSMARLNNQSRNNESAATTVTTRRQVSSDSYKPDPVPITVASAQPHRPITLFSTNMSNNNILFSVPQEPHQQNMSKAYSHSSYNKTATPVVTQQYRNYQQKEIPPQNSISPHYDGYQPHRVSLQNQYPQIPGQYLSNQQKPEQYPSNQVGPGKQYSAEQLERHQGYPSPTARFSPPGMQVSPEFQSRSQYNSVARENSYDSSYVHQTRSNIRPNVDYASSQKITDLYLRGPSSIQQRNAQRPASVISYHSVSEESPVEFDIPHSSNQWPESQSNKTGIKKESPMAVNIGSIPMYDNETASPLSDNAHGPPVYNQARPPYRHPTNKDKTRNSAMYDQSFPDKSTAYHQRYPESSEEQSGLATYRQDYPLSSNSYDIDRRNGSVAYQQGSLPTARLQDGDVDTVYPGMPYYTPPMDGFSGSYPEPKQKRYSKEMDSNVASYPNVNPHGNKLRNMNGYNQTTTNDNSFQGYNNENIKSPTTPLDFPSHFGFHTQYNVQALNDKLGKQPVTSTSYQYDRQNSQDQPLGDASAPKLVRRASNSGAVFQVRMGQCHVDIPKVLPDWERGAPEGASNSPRSSNDSDHSPPVIINVSEKMGVKVSEL